MPAAVMSTNNLFNFLGAPHFLREAFKGVIVIGAAEEKESSSEQEY